MANPQYSYRITTFPFLLFLCLSFSLSHTHTHSLSLSLTLSHTHTLTLSLTHSSDLSLSLSFFHFWWQIAGVFGVTSLAEAKAITGVRGELVSNRDAYRALWLWGGRYAPDHDPNTSLIARAVRAVRTLRDNIPIPSVVESMNLAWDGKGATEEQLDDLVRAQLVFVFLFIYLCVCVCVCVCVHTDRHVCM